MTQKPTIIKNSNYSRLLIEEGARIPSDVDGNFEMELPPWADKDRIKKAQLFFLCNLNATVRCIILGLLQIIPEESIFKILEFTKQSSTPQKAYRRYKTTFLHGNIWGSYELKPGTKAWESLSHIRKVHVNISRRTTPNGLGFISQKDMAITQFAFVGMQLLLNERVGIYGSREQFENFAHNWRVLGYLLGIQDRFNVCGETLDETLGRIEAMREDILLPNFLNLNPKVENYLRIAVEGMKGFEPWLHADSSLFIVKRCLGVPGYCFSENEDLNVKDANIHYTSMSLYSRFRVTTDVIIFEILSKRFVFRWFFNILRLSFSVFNHFPIFAILKFGRKNAYVEVLKSSKLTEKSKSS